MNLIKAETCIASPKRTITVTTGYTSSTVERFSCWTWIKMNSYCIFTPTQPASHLAVIIQVYLLTFFFGPCRNLLAWSQQNKESFFTTPCQIVLIQVRDELKVWRTENLRRWKLLPEDGSVKEPWWRDHEFSVTEQWGTQSVFTTMCLWYTCNCNHVFRWTLQKLLCLWQAGARWCSGQ